MALGREGTVIPIATLSLDGHTVQLDWKQDGETCRYRFESEEEKAVEIRQVEPGVYSVLTANRAYEARIDGQSVAIGGRKFSVEVQDPRRWDRNRNHRHAEGRQSLAASMPGKVVRVLVAEGDLVEPGQGLVVVEAMKMQNEMKAVRAGKVVSLTAIAGATVSAGEILVVME